MPPEILAVKIREEIARCIIFSFFLFFLQGTAVGCGEACSDDTECSASCSYCDPTFHICSDCCGVTEEELCPTVCTWHTDECRNTNGIACTVPEVPQLSHYGFLIGALSFFLSLPLFYRWYKWKGKS